MSIFMVSRVVNRNGEIVGFGLVDTNTKEFKIVSKDELYSALLDVKLNMNRYYHIEIENLKVVKLELRGTNGSIERYPSTDLNGKLLDKPSVTILKEIVDGDKVIGYTISDYKGKIINVRSIELLDYAKQSGIANGKIVNREGHRFISSIEGSYKKHNIRGNNGSKYVSDKYDGEELVYEPKLKPILCGAYTSIDTEIQTKLMYTNDYNNITDKYIRRPLLNRDNIRIKNMIYQTNEYTLCGAIYDKIAGGDIEFNTNDVDRELDNILRMKQTREILDRNISLIESYIRDGKYYQIEKDTGIAVVPTDSLLQDKGYTQNIVIEAGLENIEYDYIDSDKIENYKNYIRLFDMKISRKIDFGNKSIALGREIRELGIDYKVLRIKSTHDDYKVETSKVPIEAIYADYSEYSNVEVQDKYMIIRGLDGVYKYNMDKVLKDYGRELSKSNRSTKSKVFGYNHREILYANGDLAELYIDDKTIMIPDEVRNILTKSIEISNNNDKIIFGPNIEKCSTNAIRDIYDVKSNFQVQINCNEEVGLDVIESFKYTTKYGIKFRFSGDITIKQYANIVYNAVSDYRELNESVINITANNIEEIGDKFILGVIHYYIKDKLNNLEFFKDTHNTSTYGFADSYVRIIKAWRGFLKKKVSEEAEMKIDRAFKEINRLIRIKNKELPKSERIKIEKLTLDK